MGARYHYDKQSEGFLMTNPLRAVVVDDERLVRRELIGLLSAFRQIQVVGEAEDVSSAERVIAELNPDVLFLDIQLPKETGFDLLEKIPIRAKIVFVTAFNEYAVRAFEVNALDYLLKPVDPERLRHTIERLTSSETVDQPTRRKLEYSDRLFLMLDAHMRFLRIDGIVLITAAGDYSEVTTADGRKSLTVKRMKEWEARLPEHHFCRVHRSLMVNLEYVERVEEWFNASYRLFIKGGTEPIITSRRFSAKLREKFG